MFSSFVNMPMPLKIGVMLAGGGGLSYVLYRIEPRLIWVIVIGLALVALLLLAYRFILKRLQKRKARSMEGDIDVSSGAKPRDIKKADDLARLEDLRRKFEEGIVTFQHAGKNLYSLPWYIIVGEPGSGKTEAIRHCNIGFPPGLQDAYQGAGGTINMNWWFTDHAVILDTAGRLMFEEVQPGASSEWKEFLKLLKNNRPNCPINGMFLMIPADSLIKDTADDIERKASQIAQQFDLIQRTLDVRFPVFVIVSKSDLINGFREFFDNLDDPKLQHQILGWSNPAPLDEPFNPELIDQHLRTIQQRLRRRRLGLMQDPIPQDPDLRRSDEVDSLYSFPQSLDKIGSRLQRYLQLIFSVGSQWSGRPLFLRGIYFTSSMREGSALDSDLAEALGVPIESLPEGRVWEHDRAYFLRDVFMEKVFREKGLVTNATNAKRQHSRRRLSVIACSIVSVVLLLFLTWFGGRSLKQSIGVHHDYWVAADEGDNWKNQDRYWKPIVEPTYPGSRTWLYNGTTSHVQFPHEKGKKIDIIKIDGEDINTFQFHQELGRLAQQKIHIPWIFRLTSPLGSKINIQRDQARRALFEFSVIKPLLDSVREKMKTQKVESWAATPPATAALVQLMRIEALAQRGKSFNSEEPLPDLDTLVHYLLYRTEEKGRGDYEKTYQSWYEDRDTWQLLLQSIYDDRHDRELYAAWSGGNTLKENLSVKNGLECFTLPAMLKPGESELSTIHSFIGDLEAFKSLEEEKILKFGLSFDRDFKKLKKQSDLDVQITAWNESLAQMKHLKDSIDGNIQNVLVGGRSLMDAYMQAVETEKKKITADYKLLYQEIRKAESEKGGLISRAAEKLDVDKNSAEKKAPALEGIAPDNILAQVAQKLKKAEAKISKRIDDDARKDIKLLAVFDADFVRRDKNNNYRYENRYHAYMIANGLLSVQDSPPDMNQLPQVISSLEKKIGDTVSNTARILGTDLDTSDALAAEADGVSRFVLRMALQKRIYKLLYDVLSHKVPKKVEDIEATVKMLSEKATPVSHLRIDLTEMEEGDFETIYHPEAAQIMMKVWKSLKRYIDPQKDSGIIDLIGREDLARLYAVRQKTLENYAIKYFTYWTEDVFDDMQISGDNWRDFHKKIDDLSIRSTSNSLQDLYSNVRNALYVGIDEVLKEDMKNEFVQIRETVEKSLKSIKAKGYGNWKELITNWSYLGADPSIAFQKLLKDMPPAMRLGDFKEKYFLFPEDAEEDEAVNIGKYWNDICLKALALLAADFAERKREILEKLKWQYSKFPLAMQKSLQDLTLKEINDLNNILKLIIIPPFEKTREQALDSHLDKLRTDESRV
ncbi:MAG: hypothetical protein KAT56_08525, partial [Sedimentisphaerales bacterium]|nr:hypothetical protein [Sedimentisphaerales bacterium]